MAIIGITNSTNSQTKAGRRKSIRRLGPLLPPLGSLYVRKIGLNMSFHVWTSSPSSTR